MLFTACAKPNWPPSCGVAWYIRSEATIWTDTSVISSQMGFMALIFGRQQSCTFVTVLLVRKQCR